jgi:hypothetical protein
MRSLILALCLAAGSVSAKPVALTRSAQGAIVLDDEQGQCPAESKAALFMSPAGNVPGCWFIRHGFVWLFFADGDVGAVPEKALKWESV